MEFAQRLKLETTPEHESLEQKLNIMRSDLTLDDYKHVLSRFYGFYDTLERKFFSQDHHPFFDDRKKTSLLEADLRSLGLNPEQIDKIPASQLPSMEKAEEQMGMMYVLEGSTLGGQVLQKYFHQKFGLTPDNGLRYFSGYGDQTMPRWRAFQGLLAESLQKDALEQNVIILSARQTFQALEHWLMSSR